ncbi:hypothetical protein ES707_20984 [subsurface metagenome]
MARRPNGLRIDDPAFPLLQAFISYWGPTTANGGAGGATLICADLVNQPEFDGNQAVIISGPYGGQARDINGTTLLGTVTPASNFGGVITANTIFAILPIRTVPAEVAALVVLVNALATGIAGATGIFHEQEDVPFNVNAVLAAEADILNLAVADTRYIVRSLRLKCVDPGAETVTVRLYELINDAGPLEVDSFAITNANFATYHSLMDMFGLPHLAGDELQITVQATAVGPYAVTGQYSHGKTNV